MHVHFTHSLTHMSQVEGGIVGVGGGGFRGGVTRRITKKGDDQKRKKKSK